MLFWSLWFISGLLCAIWFRYMFCILENNIRGDYDNEIKFFCPTPRYLVGHLILICFPFPYIIFCVAASGVWLIEREAVSSWWSRPICKRNK